VFSAKDFASAVVFLHEDKNRTSYSMNQFTSLILCLAVLSAAPASAQLPEKTTVPAATRSLTKLNLDFPGGTPAQLVAAIQKAMGRPLNVVISEEYATWRLPPVKVNNVDVVQLFRAIEIASQTRELVPTGGGSYSQAQSSFGFKESSSGAPSDDTIWSFFVNASPKMPKLSRFFLLTPYLDRGLTVDDITTAIQTGWKMRGDKETPTLSFHNETKLLIAVGEYGGLDTIESVLKALDPMNAKPAPAVKSASETKTKP
jgi:hypothetical protein